MAYLAGRMDRDMLVVELEVGFESVDSTKTLVMRPCCVTSSQLLSPFASLPLKPSSVDFLSVGLQHELQQLYLPTIYADGTAWAFCKLVGYSYIRLSPASFDYGSTAISTASPWRIGNLLHDTNTYHASRRLQRRGVLLRAPF